MQTCLIVDEAPVVRKVASRILLKLDMAVESVATPDDAQRWIEENGLPDIIVVSAPAHDDNAVKFVRDVCGPGKPSGTVILASIVESNLGLMTRLKRAGVEGFVMKPFDRLALEESLQPYLPGTMAG